MTFRPKNTQERVLHRLKITRGHLSKVIDMVEKGEYCIDVIHQSQAVQRALKETDSVLLEYHLKTCVADQIRKGQRDKAVLEVIKVFEKKS